MDTEKITTNPKEIAPCQYAMDITIPATEVNHLISGMESNFARHAKIPGFRPGRTPSNLVTGRFAKKINEEVRGELVNTGLRTALERCEANPVTMPTIAKDAIGTIEKNKDFTFTIEFDIAPTVELPKYDGIKLTDLEVKVEEKDTDGFIDKLLGERSTFSQIDRAAEENDMLKLSYKTTEQDDDNIPVSARQLLESSETWLLLGDPELIPGTKTGLLGVVSGDERSLDVTFPDDFYEPALTGKTLQYHFKIHEIHARVKPELTDEFAKSVGSENVEHLKTVIKDKLLYDKEVERRKYLERQVSDYLVDKTKFPLPPKVLELEKQHALSASLEQWKRTGLSFESVFKDEEERGRFLKTIEDTATRRLKLQYIMTEIGRKESIKIPDAEINAQVERFHQERAASGNGKNNPIDEDALRSTITLNLLMANVITKLIEIADVEERSSGT